MRIFISGQCRAGKTTLANQLANYIDCPTYAYADRLKELAVQYNPSLAPEIYAETKTPATRQLLGSIAMQYKAKFGNNVFTNLVHNKCLNTDSSIVSDLRFRDELALVKRDFPNAVILYVGTDISEYDCRDIFMEMDILLPPRPIKNELQLANLVQRIKLLYGHQI